MLPIVIKHQKFTVLFMPTKEEAGYCYNPADATQALSVNVSVLADRSIVQTLFSTIYLIISLYCAISYVNKLRALNLPQQ